MVVDRNIFSSCDYRKADLKLTLSVKKKLALTNLVVVVVVYTCLCVQVYATICMRRAENNCMESCLSFYLNVGSGVGIQANRFTWQMPLPTEPSHWLKEWAFCT
jgi:hypothetical protein